MEELKTLTIGEDEFEIVDETCRQNQQDLSDRVDSTLSSIVTGVKGNSEQTYRNGQVNITKNDIGLGSVDNTADANKSVRYADSALKDGIGNVISNTYMPLSADVGKYYRVAWGTTLSFNLQTGHHALMFKNNAELWLLWMAGDGLNSTCITGTSTSTTITDSNSLVTVTSSTNAALTAVVF